MPYGALNNNNSLLDKPPFTSDHHSYKLCEKGLVSAVYPLTQTIDAVINGSPVLGVQVCPSLNAGPRGMAMPRVNDMILLSRVEGVYYCVALLPAKYEPTRKSTVKYDPADVVKNYRDSVDRSKDENLRESSRTTDPDSYLTHRALVRPGDAVIYRSDNGAAIVGSNDGEILNMGSPVCYSSWATKDNLHYERMENHVYEHTAGMMRWYFDRKTNRAHYSLSRFTRANKNGFVLSEEFEERAGAVMLKSLGKRESGRTSKFWDITASDTGTLTLRTLANAKTNLTITVTPQGSVTIESQDAVDIQAKRGITVASAQTVMLKAKTVKLTGNDTEIKSAYNISIESQNKNISVKAPRGTIDMRAKKIQMNPAPKVSATLTSELKRQIDSYVKKSVALNTKKRR